jgi:AraC-like DNA-binding protein
VARELGTREHSLRRLSNTTLGFRNFSAFLNSYRIPEACDRLKERADAIASNATARSERYH